LTPVSSSASRLLLLLPTTTYRTEAFVEAATRLGVELVCASERPSTFEPLAPDSLITLDFADPRASAETIARFAQRRPIDAVVPVDDLTTVVAATISQRLGLKANSLPAVSTARDKHAMRRCLAEAGVPVPRFRLVPLADDPAARAAEIEYPCVLKPLSLSASRGVIRANDAREFVAAFRRISAILEMTDVSLPDEARRALLVEEFIPGVEVALEGLLVGGTLHVLAIFDKPDPLDGPFFEETIYVTPSRLPEAMQTRVAAVSRDACSALGLTEGPIHAELRLNERGPFVLEVAARSIGGLCSRTLTFGTGLSLEELILCHALGTSPRIARARATCRRRHDDSDPARGPARGGPRHRRGRRDRRDRGSRHHDAPGTGRGAAPRGLAVSRVHLRPRRDAGHGRASAPKGPRAIALRH
jgi:biotin carboxylase